MIGFDLLIDKKTNNQLLSSSINKIFGLSENNILFCEDIPDTPISSEIQLMVVVTSITGDMKILIEFYPQESFGIDINPIDIAIGVSKSISCKCLIEEDSENPYSFLLIDQDQVTKTMLDASEIDENEKYVLKIEV